MNDRKKKVSLQSLAFGCTVLAAVLAGAWFLFPLEEAIVQRQQKPIRQQAEPAAEDNRTTAAGTKSEEKEKDVFNRNDLIQPQEQLLFSETATLPPTTAEPVVHSEQAVPADNSSQNGCSQQAERLHRFLQESDQKEYVREFKLNPPLPNHFKALLAKLSASPPTVIRETDSLNTVLANKSHLFRTLGRDNILLVKKMLEQEQAKTEDMAAALYDAVIAGQCCPDLEMPLDKACDYAAFFLNTMGGCSYLFRRSAAVRLLAEYYAVLVLDKAGQEKANAYGIDLSALISQLIQEIESTTQLSRKDEYLARLYTLEKKYPAKQ